MTNDKYEEFEELQESKKALYARARGERNRAFQPTKF